MQDLPNIIIKGNAFGFNQIILYKIVNKNLILSIDNHRMVQVIVSNFAIWISIFHESLFHPTLVSI
jgi:hypothetical protein